MLDYQVKKTRSGLTLTIDPDLAHDIVLLLDVLADLARVIRGKAEAQDAAKQAKLDRVKKKVAIEFDRKALAMLARYTELTARTDHQTARVCCQGEFRLSTLKDVDIFLMQGRKITGTPKKKPRRDPREAKNRFFTDRPVENDLKMEVV